MTETASPQSLCWNSFPSREDGTVFASRALSNDGSHDWGVVRTIPFPNPSLPCWSDAPKQVLPIVLQLCAVAFIPTSTLCSVDPGREPPIGRPAPLPRACHIDQTWPSAQEMSASWVRTLDGR